MKRYIANILFFVLPLVAFSQPDNITVQIKKANELYKQNHYSDAALIYEEVLKKGASAELYYNLGNAYYKSGELGKSILNYERSLRLKPFNEDVRYNLDFVRLKVVDNVVTTPGFFMKKWTNNLIDLLSTNNWAIISIFLFIIFLDAVLFFVFHPLRRIRKASFYTGFLLAILCSITFIFSGVKKDRMVKHKDAIIMSGIVTAKSSPDKSGTDLFQLHEGSKVHIQSVVGNWAEIKLENNAVGWIEESAIERI